MKKSMFYLPRKNGKTKMICELMEAQIKGWEQRERMEQDKKVSIDVLIVKRVRNLTPSDVSVWSNEYHSVQAPCSGCGAACALTNESILVMASSKDFIVVCVECQPSLAEWAEEKKIPVLDVPQVQKPAKEGMH